MIEIQKGIPMPARPGGTGRIAQYPWRTMEVGDSFFIPGKTSCVGVHITKSRQRTGFRFTARTIKPGPHEFKNGICVGCGVRQGSEIGPEHGVGVRVWRYE